jgi:hypothetical protein
MKNKLFFYGAVCSEKTGVGWGPLALVHSTVGNVRNLATFFLFIRVEKIGMVTFWSRFFFV